MKTQNIEKTIQFWKAHYFYVKDVVDRIDAGEDVKPDSLAASEVGQRQHCIDEANIAVDRLAAVGCFDLPKIK